MKNINFVKTAVAITLAASSMVAVAQSTASLEIINGFAVQEDAALIFGTIRAAQDLDGGTLTGGNKGAGINILPVVGAAATVSEVVVGTIAGGGGDEASSVQSLIDGTPASYTVTGAAPGARMNITLPAEFQLDDGSTPAFDVNIVNSDVIIATGPNSTAVYDGTNAETDGTGSVTFLVGGTLTIDEAITAAIEDGDYTGTYNVVVSY
jgi:hypothetical protein